MPDIVDPNVFRTILEHLQMAVYVVGRDGKIAFWNDGAERITGYLRQEVIGRTCGDTFLGEIDVEEDQGLGFPAPATVAVHEPRALHAQVSLRHKSGHRVLVQLWTFPIRNAQGTVVGRAETFQELMDIAEWDRRQTKLATYGCIDLASGVLTHGIMQAHLREQMGMFAEHPVPFSLLCMQIDGLDNIQTRDGPGAIAAVLRVVGQTLENSLRPTDFLGRWQENQFLAILTECSASEIARAAERLRRMVSNSRIAWWGDRLPVTISLGATAVKAGDSVEAMVIRAERALQDSVARGGNCSSVRDDDVGRDS